MSWWGRASRAWATMRSGVRGGGRWFLLARVLTRVADVQLSDVTSGYRAVNRRGMQLFAQHYPAEYFGRHGRIAGYRRANRVSPGSGAGVYATSHDWPSEPGDHAVNPVPGARRSAGHSPSDLSGAGPHPSMSCRLSSSVCCRRRLHGSSTVGLGLIGSTVTLGLLFEMLRRPSTPREVRLVLGLGRHRDPRGRHLPRRLGSGRNLARGGGSLQPPLLRGKHGLVRHQRAAQFGTRPSRGPEPHIG